MSGPGRPPRRRRLTVRRPADSPASVPAGGDVVRSPAGPGRRHRRPGLVTSTGARRATHAAAVGREDGSGVSLALVGGGRAAPGGDVDRDERDPAPAGLGPQPGGDDGAAVRPDVVLRLVERATGCRREIGQRTRPTTPSSVPGVAAAGTRPASRRTWSGPRSVSQNRTGYSSWRIAETLRSCGLAALLVVVPARGPGQRAGRENDGALVGRDRGALDRRVGPRRPGPRRPPPAAATARGGSSSFEPVIGRAEVNSNRRPGGTRPESRPGAAGEPPGGAEPAGSTSHSAET